MTAPRVLAIFLAACALAASALATIPEESFEALASGSAAGFTASVPDEKPAVYRPASKPTESDDHAAVPRLWLR
jgi:hypothetical protein